MKYRGIQFTKTTNLLGQPITLNNTTTKAFQDRLNKAKNAWKLIKHRSFIDPGIKLKARLQLWNAAIYSILRYGLCTLRIQEAMQIKLQQFTSKCTRDIVEAGEQYSENPDEWAKEHATNEDIRRGSGIPTIESRLQGVNYVIFTDGPQ